MTRPVLEDAPRSPSAPAAVPPGPTRWSIVLIGAVLVALVMVGAVARAWLTDLRAGTAPTRPSAGPGGPGPGAGSINGRATAVFDVASAARSVTVRGAADLDGALYRVSGAIVKQSGDVVRATGDGHETMTVELNNHITWRVRLSDGALSETLQLRDIQLSGIEVAGSAASVDLTLGAARGTVPVSVSAWVDEFAMHLPEDVPVQVRAAAGVDRTTFDRVTHIGVAGGSRFVSDGWDVASDRYDIDITAHITTLTVDRR